MIHLGDITQIDGAEIPPVDVITGGSPCQDLSIAGGRAGLAGERSGLFMEMIRVVKEMRYATAVNGFRPLPRYMVWENVVGALSSNNGDDFRAVLEETARVVAPDADVPRPAGKWGNSGTLVGNGYSISWCVHDSQYWGVPQRRRRLCMVCDFDGYTAPTVVFNPQLRGETTGSDPEQADRCASAGRRPEILPVGKSLQRYSDPGAEPGESAAGGTAGGVGSPNSYTLKIRGGVEIDSHGKRAGKGALVQTELAGTLGVTQDQTLITAYGISPYDSNAMLSDNPNSGIYLADTARTLDHYGGSPACHQGGMAIVMRDYEEARNDESV